MNCFSFNKKYSNSLHFYSLKKTFLKELFKLLYFYRAEQEQSSKLSESENTCESNMEIDKTVENCLNENSTEILPL